jgi:hypothetical protein
MPFIAAGIGAGASLLGSALSSSSQRRAAQASADAQIRAAQIAADAQRFRPVGVTTGFGSSQFTTDAQGNLIGAGYELNPQLQALRGNLLSQATAYDPTQIAQQAQALGGGAQSLFGAAQGYLTESPEQARQRFIAQQQALLSPMNEQELAGVRNRLFQTGRTGLATGGTSAGNMAATNPELAAYYNSLARQQSQLAAGAEQAAQQQQAFGAGLFGSGAGLLGQQTALTAGAYSPLSTQLGLAGNIEELGQQSLNIGAALGGRVTAGSAAAGNLLGQGMTNAALTTQRASQVSPMGSALQGLGSNQQFNTGVSNWFSNVLNPNSTSSPFYNRGADVFSPSYMGGTSYGE